MPDLQVVPRPDGDVELEAAATPERSRKTIVELASVLYDLVDLPSADGEAPPQRTVLRLEIQSVTTEDYEP